MTLIALDQKCNLTSTSFVNEVFGFDTTNPKVGQTFFPSISQKIGQISVQLLQTGSPTDNLIMKLWSVNTHLPVTLLETSSTTLAGTSLTTTMTLCLFIFSSTVLVSGTEYAWTVERSGSLSTTSNYSIYRTNGSNDYSGYSLTNNTTTWVSNAVNDRYFQEYYIQPPNVIGIASLKGITSLTM